MKKVLHYQIVIMMALSMFLSSCSAIAGIFKAGMGVGIFIVVAIVAIVVFVAMRFGKKNN